MSESFIFGLTTSTVTLGVNGYSLIIVTGSAEVTPATSGAPGVYAPMVVNGDTLTNYGTIGAAGGTYNRNFGGGIGGIGVYFKGADALFNSGTIVGGNGGYGESGGVGGVGVQLTAAGTLTNDETIIGGHAAFSRVGSGSRGGAGVNLAAAGTLLNDGTIQGGSGAGSGSGGSGANGGAGGIGITRIGDSSGYGGVISNDGVVAGGNGAAGEVSGDGGSGGSGLALYNSAATLTINNYGTIAGGNGGAGGGGLVGFPAGSGGAGGYGVRLPIYGVLTNDRIITGGAGGYGGIADGASGGAGIFLGTGAVINNGTITGGAGGKNYEGIAGAGGTGVVLDGGTLINAGIISGGAGRLEIQSGYLGSSGDSVMLESVSTLIVEPGAEFNGAVVADGAFGDVLELAGTSSADLSGIGTEFTGFQNISFSLGATWVVEGNYTAFDSNQTITGFSNSDTIILDDFVTNTIDSTYVSGSGLELTNALNETITVDIQGNFSNADFDITDSAGSTEIETVICYLRGTRISTPAGEIAVEDLKIGDPVITRFNGYRPIKWIGRQSFARRFVQNNRDQIPVCVSPGSLGPSCPRRHLFVSPGHSMLIDGVLVLAKTLVNGVTITQNHAPEEIHYYQIEFETHDCVMAEGAWSESYADTPGFRKKFHNVAEFDRLYPAHHEPESQSLCAPRPVSGPVLYKVLEPIIAHAFSMVRPGKLLGFIDEITGCGQVRGWAWDEQNPELPVLLEIVVRGYVIGKVLACDYRGDLKAAGFGLGNCAFVFTSSVGIPLGVKSDVEVRRVGDGATIVMSEVCIAEAGIKPRSYNSLGAQRLAAA